MTNSPANTTPAANTTANPPRDKPSEVGWQFVPQYYTSVNKQPNRLHCFYTKRSTFVHGTEGEDVKSHYGQQEIHDKITSIGFHDCKVFIHSVDAQASADDGIIIQVIGEMSNRGDPWRKFVQTFFLAKQPNGYFVLNDIFRYLKEETADSDDGEEDFEAAAPLSVSDTEPAVSVSPVIPVEATPATSRGPSSPIPVAASPAAPAPAVVAPAVVEALTPDIPNIIQTPTPEPELEASPSQSNGIYTPDEEKISPNLVPEKSPARTPSPLPVSTPLSVDTSPAPNDIASTNSLGATSPAAASPYVQAPPPSSPPAAVPSSGTRSWASLAATNSKKWGAAVAQESRGVTETPVVTNSGGNRNPSSGSGAGNRGSNHHHHNSHPGMMAAAQKVSIPSVFVKGVTEPISETRLTGVLTSRFGPIKDLEIVRGKACAFFDFTTVDAAKRAIIASLPANQGGEGGIWIDGNRIQVETRRERGDRPVSRSRGGAPQSSSANGGGETTGRGGGYSRGGNRGGGGGRGRGGYHSGTK